MIKKKEFNFDDFIDNKTKYTYQERKEKRKEYSDNMGKKKYEGMVLVVKHQKW